MTLLGFYYFQNFREADDWLDFECSEEECEQRAWTDSDRYAEWAMFCNAWEAEGHFDLDSARGAERHA